MDSLRETVMLVGSSALLLLVVGPILVLVLERWRARARSWRAAARRLGLDRIVETRRLLLRGPTLTGRWKGLNVQLKIQRRYSSGTLIAVEDPQRGAADLSLHRAGLARHGRKVTTGDADFDARIHVEGPAPLALAVLSAAARKRVLRLMGGQFDKEGRFEPSAGFEDGVLEMYFRDNDLDGSGDRFSHAVEMALGLALRLRAPDDLPGRLAENLREEGNPGVRLEILRALAHQFPHHPAIRKALADACQDRSDEVRLRAAVALGEEADSTVFELIADGDTADGCAARAVTALADRLPTGEARELLERALATGRRATALACLDALGSRGHTAAEDLCLQALESGDPPIAVAAAQALGQAGTVAAVPPLRAKTSPAAPGALRGAARQAIAAIQSRLTGAMPGQLAIAAEDAGALSFACADVGRLSLTPRTAPGNPLWEPADQPRQADLEPGRREREEEAPAECRAPNVETPRGASPGRHRLRA